MNDSMVLVASDYPRTASHELTVKLIGWLEQEAQRQHVSRSKLVRTILTQAMEASEHEPAAVTGK